MGYEGHDGYNSYDGYRSDRSLKKLHVITRKRAKERKCKQGDFTWFEPSYPQAIRGSAIGAQA